MSLNYRLTIIENEETTSIDMNQVSTSIRSTGLTLDFSKEPGNQQQIILKGTGLAMSSGDNSFSLPLFTTKDSDVLEKGYILEQPCCQLISFYMYSRNGIPRLLDEQES